MSLGAPALLYALLLLVPALAAFLVRRRREVLAVPSTFLWRTAGVARARSSRLRNLVRLLALAACMIAIGALVVAAARPGNAAGGRTVAYVVDVSASMGDGSRGSPLAEARSFLRRELRARGRGERVVVVAAGRRPERLAGPTAIGEELEAALDRLGPSTEAADLAAAVELAAALVEREPGPRVVVVHDGGLAAGGAPRLAASVPLRERRCRRLSGDNLGVTTLATRPVSAGDDPEEREVLVTVATSSDRERRATVLVEAFGVAIARRDLEVPASGEAEVRLRVRSPATELVARVRARDGLDDLLGADDSAAVAHGPAVQRRVVLVGSSGEDGEVREFFVVQALRAAGVVEIERVAPAEAAAAVGAEDVVVALDRAPSGELGAPVLYLGTSEGPLPVGTPRRLSAASGQTRLRSVDDRHPLLRGVSLDEVTIESASAGEVPATGRALVELDGGPVVVAGGAGRSGWVYLGIDPMSSDLVLRVAFPVLVSNALGVLGGAAQVAVAEVVPRSEVSLAEGAELGGAAAEVARLGLPVSPVALLATLAILLLAAELLAFRRGWVR